MPDAMPTVITSCSSGRIVNCSQNSSRALGPACMLSWQTVCLPLLYACGFGGLPRPKVSSFLHYTSKSACLQVPCHEPFPWLITAGLPQLSHVLCLIHDASTPNDNQKHRYLSQRALPLTQAPRSCP